MHKFRIGEQVSLKQAQSQQGTIADHSQDPSDVGGATAFLVEWEDHSSSWHRSFELSATRLIHHPGREVRRWMRD